MSIHRDRPLLIVSNRLPAEPIDGGWHPPVGGLVTALRPVVAERATTWVGWDGGHDELPEIVEGLEARLRPLSLTAEQVDGFYHGFANRTLWPLLHDLVEPPTIDHETWESYRSVNALFAAAVEDTLAAIGETPVVWIHDYHLMLLPALLRARHPKLPIAFYLHTPFPPSELFLQLPWRRELLEGLLGAHVVSLQTPGDRANLVRSCRRVLDPDELETPDHRVVHRGRATTTTANPISIDADEFAQSSLTPAVTRELDQLREQYAGRRVLLGVDRLDYTKGIVERLEAFEQLLERRGDLVDELVLVQIAVPSRATVPEYRQVRTKVEEIAGRINGRFTQPMGPVPLEYLRTGVSRSQLLAFYRLAEVMLVTPRRDGMNLVAKEYVVCQHAGDHAGILVLSEFTGAAYELTGAVPCNPFDPRGMSEQIEAALGTDPDDRRARLATMAAHIHDHDTHDWLRRELSALTDLVDLP